MRVIFTLLVVIVVGTLGYTFAPTAFGGLATYAATSGTSMAPDFETGDLVILRKSGPLRVGDIGGYRSGITGQIVVHRVIAEDNGRLVFQGDNNWWTDTYQPTQDEVIGKLWIHVGGAGEKIEGIHPLWVLGGIGGVMAMALKDTGTPKPAGRRSKRGTNPTFAGQGMQVLLLAVLVVAAVSGMLAVWAYRAPSTVAVERVVSARHTGAFTYEGAATPGPVYPDGKVQTGEPIFIKFAPVVTASFEYQLDAPGAENVQGTVRLIAVARGANGYEQSLELIPTTAFSGTHAVIETEVDLAPIMVLVEELEAATGIAVSYWTVAVSAEVFVQGSIGGQAFAAPFSPFYTLRVQPPDEIFVETSLTRDFESAPPLIKPRLGTAFFPVQDLTVSIPDREPATMSLVFADVGVDRVRAVAGPTAALSVVVVLAVLTLIALALRSPAAQLYARYGSRMVRVAEIAPPAAGSVTVSTMHDLVRVADRFQSIILWAQEDDQDVFTVRENHTDFVYRGGT
jgi:signal peptidase I